MCNSSCYNRRAARRSARRCRIPRIASTVNPESDLGKGSYVPYHVADGIPRGVMLMHRAWILGLVLFAVFLSAPLFASGRATAASTTGTVQIVYPLNGAALGIEGTRVQLSVSNFVLDPNNLPCVATDHGRIRLYVNDTLVQETTNTTTSLPSLAPTDIKLGAQLVCTDSSPFNPEVWHNITISVGEPTVKILNPGRPLAVSTAGVRVAFSVTRFALDPANYAGPRIPGAG